MKKLKDFEKSEERFTSGHRTCTGCSIPLIVRQVLRATDKPVVVVAATGCLEVTSTIYPYSSWNVPFMHSAFENAAATISGIESAFKALKKLGKISNEMKFVVFGGDGGTYDIGLQALSGAVERGHDFVYVCYDNEAYMNTGNQRSSATPFGAATTTTPVGKVMDGKQGNRKDIMKIMVAHDIPYAAQVSVSHWQDFYKKASKAFETKGPSFINALCSCNLGWGHDPSISVDILKLAVETGFWPLYEVENGKYSHTVKIEKRKPIAEFLKHQKRFKHLFKPKKNTELLDRIQKEVDKKYSEISALSSNEASNSN